MQYFFRLFSFFFFLYCLFSPHVVDAFVLSPLRTSVVIDPGKSDTVTIRVKNNEESNILIEPYLDAFTIDEKTGKAIWGRSDISKRWIESNIRELTLNPGEEKEIIFSINIPSDAEPGAHYLGLFAQKKTGSSQISASTRIGSLLFLYIGGAIVEDFSNDSFYLSKKFYIAPPVKIFFQFTNKGSLHIIPSGKILLRKGVFQKKIISEENINPLQYKVLPHISWNKEFIFLDFEWNDIGWYTIDMEVKYGMEGNTYKDSLSFFYCSKSVLSLIFSFIFLVGVFLFFWMKNRKKYATSN